MKTAVDDVLLHFFAFGGRPLFFGAAFFFEGAFLAGALPPTQASLKVGVLMSSPCSLPNWSRALSGGATKDREGLLDEVRALRDGGANGSIIGRNTFQRPRAEALNLLGDIIDIYKGKA